MALPLSGPISLSQVNVELGFSATAQISLNDAIVRTLFDKASGQISMSDGYGKANEFPFTISSNQTNADLRTLAINAGWNQFAKVICTIDNGIYISGNSTTTPALTVSGSFPSGAELINNGFIIGRGGNGGGGSGFVGNNASGATAGSGGTAGGPALSVSSAVSIRNNNTIGGGGGGGGGGRGLWYDGVYGDNNVGGGGGGGGRSSNAVNSSGGAGGAAANEDINQPGNAGSAGTVSSAGVGGAPTVGQGEAGNVRSGGGGGGGEWGATGGTGGAGVGNVVTTFSFGPYTGGAGGAAVSGNSNITWLATGTRLGAIS